MKAHWGPANTNAPVWKLHVVHHATLFGTEGKVRKRFGEITLVPKRAGWHVMEQAQYRLERAIRRQVEEWVEHERLKRQPRPGSTHVRGFREQQAVDKFLASIGR